MVLLEGREVGVQVFWGLRGAGAWGRVKMRFVCAETSGGALKGWRPKSGGEAGLVGSMAWRRSW